MLKRTIIFCIIAWILCPGAWAGGGPQNVLIVVNERSPESLELGAYYRQKRGIPERNVCRIAVTPGAHNISAADFERRIRGPVREYIEQHGLEQQIHFLALCMDTPTRVEENESVTAALFHGFKNAPPNPPCTLPDNTSNFYYRTERAFLHDLAGPGEKNYLAMMLAGPTPEDAKRLVDRAVASDGTAPSGTFYLLKPLGDPARNVRYKRFDDFDFHARFMEGFPNRVFRNHPVLLNLKDVMGYLTGRTAHEVEFWDSTVFLPGAIADHFTSFGGRLPIPPMNHGSVLQWIGAGATASYGTVNEPCSFLEKFPDPMVFFWYARGFSLAESYWMSVAQPFQGLFVGEPLAAPYARPPTVTVMEPAPGAVVSGVVTVKVTAVAAPERFCSAIDWYVDDLFVRTVTNITAQSWNEIRVEIDGQRYAYILGDRDDLFSAVDGLARDIKRRNPMLNAIPYGDRLMLMDGRIGKPGTSTPVRVRVERGLGPEPTLHARALTPHFLDSTYPARQYLMLNGTANEGDAVECVVTLAGGMIVTARVEAAKGETAQAVVTRLEQTINSHERLKSAGGLKVANKRGSDEQMGFSVEAVTPGAEGMAIQIRYHIMQARPGSGLHPPVVYEGRLRDTIDLLSSRGMLQFAVGKEELQATFPWDTTTHPDGPITLRLVARDGTAIQTQGHALLDVVVQNDP